MSVQSVESFILENPDSTWEDYRIYLSSHKKEKTTKKRLAEIARQLSRKCAWDVLMAEKKRSQERVAVQLVDAHQNLAHLAPANQLLIRKFLPSPEGYPLKRKCVEEEFERMDEPLDETVSGDSPKKKGRINADSEVKDDNVLEDPTVNVAAMDKYGKFIFDGKDLAVQIEELGKYKTKICLESHIDIYLARRGVLLLKPAQFEIATLSVFGSKTLQALMKHITDILPIKPSDAYVRDDFITRMRSLRKDFLRGRLTHRTLENQLALDITQTDDGFERKIMKTMLNWVELLPPSSLNHDLSESARISVFSNLLITSLFTVPQESPPLCPPKAVAYWSATTPSKATAERKALNGEQERANDTRHDFAGHVLVQTTPIAQCVDGEGKKSNASSSLSSIHWDLARLGVAGRDAILASMRRGVRKPHHITFQVVESTMIIYCHVPMGNNWCAMMETGKIGLPESWEDPKFLGFLDELDVPKRAMLLYSKQVDTLWELFNEPARPKSPSRDEHPGTAILTTPQAKKTMDTTKNCRRPTNMTWK